MSDMSESLVEQLSIVHHVTMSCMISNAVLMERLPPPTTPKGLVLQHGVARLCTTDKLPKGIRKRRPKECFMNAAALVFNHPQRFIYCEGYAIRAALGIVVGEHAWVLDRENNYQVIDTTWRKPAPGAYLGSPFSQSYLETCMLASSYYGLLDNPKLHCAPLLAEPREFLHADAQRIRQDFTHSLRACMEGGPT